MRSTGTFSTRMPIGSWTLATGCVPGPPRDSRVGPLTGGSITSPTFEAGTMLVASNSPHSHTAIDLQYRSGHVRACGRVGYAHGAKSVRYPAARSTHGSAHARSSGSPRPGHR